MSGTNKRKVILLVALIVLVVCLVAIVTPILILRNKKTDEESTLAMTVLKTDRLPSNGTALDYRIMPYVGNGHVATVVFSDLIYMNGLYNGENGTSHRARIPSTLNWQFNLGSSMKSSLYSLDVGTGAFIEKLETNQVRIERRIFASQEYTELLLAHVTITRLAEKGSPINIPVQAQESMTSVDFNFNQLARDDRHVVLFGQTKERENNRFQADLLNLYIYFTPLPTRGFELEADETSRTYLFVTSLDTEQSRANRSFHYASTQRRPDEMWSAHIDLWRKVWRNGRIEVKGDQSLQEQIDTAFYYILSSLPPLSTSSEHKQFYGLSPGSLSRGGRLGEDYGGHSFWDTETWMYPTVLLFYPKLAKEILSYRINLNESAAYNARLFNYEGWRYPWESARTGIDVTPDCCPEVRLYEIHITGDISLAARQYIAATGDQTWLTSEMGGTLIYETARFWASRTVYNPIRKQYEILMVLPPDEDAQPFKNNSVYTNAVAALAIQLADRVSCITQKPVPSQWMGIATNLYFPFDNVSQIHLEYEDFNPKNTTIKQADAILLGFPLMWPMSKEVRRNDLLVYEPITRDDGPAMTWSMHAIGFLELKDYEEAQKLFTRSYKTYVRPPFNVWTEAQSGVGAVNFITGAGGFLQAITFGYGGIRLTLDALDIMPPSRLPNNATALIFHGLKYYGGVFDLKVENQMYYLTVEALDLDQGQTLLYEHSQRNGTLTKNSILNFPTETRLVIRPKDALCL